MKRGRKNREREKRKSEEKKEREKEEDEDEERRKRRREKEKEKGRRNKIKLGLRYFVSPDRPAPMRKSPLTNCGTVTSKKITSESVRMRRTFNCQHVTLKMLL